MPRGLWEVLEMNALVRDWSRSEPWGRGLQGAEPCCGASSALGCCAWSRGAEARGASKAMI